MAVAEDPKSSGDASGDMPIFNAEHLQNNMKSIHYSRTFLSIIGGVVAGIWGFTGLMGFIFYFLIMAIASLGLAAKAKFSIHNYFDCWNRIIVDGFLGGLLLTAAPIILMTIFRRERQQPSHKLMENQLPVEFKERKVTTFQKKLPKGDLQQKWQHHQNYANYFLMGEGEVPLPGTRQLPYI